MLSSFYNPDILTCLANLSSDEVFTPPNVANQMLDTLPTELWSDKTITFLDPVSKSGVFLREITKRLIKGLENEFPDIEGRIQHILKNQVFGLGITGLTSEISRRTLYCSKKANGEYSIVDFGDEEGNLKYIDSHHFWADGIKCKYCGVNKKLYQRNKGLESYAYSFIHEDKPEELFNMKFDVIIGNPPYQMMDGGGTGKSAKPIYNLFVEQATKLKPRYLCFIIPSRWFLGGKGLDSFREKMINEKKISTIVDFENSSEVFPGVDIAGGVCYFLWEREFNGDCKFINKTKDAEIESTRPLNQFKVIIRNSSAIDIINKVISRESTFDGYLNSKISIRRPFGINSNHKPTEKGTPCYFTQKIGKKYVHNKDYSDRLDLKDKWKLLIPFAPIAGQTDFSKPIKFFNENNILVAKPGEIASETWLVAFSSEKEHEVLNFKKYLETKFFRFMLLQMVISQNITRNCYSFVPNLKHYKNEVNDNDLYKMFDISKREQQLINSKII